MEVTRDINFDKDYPIKIVWEQNDNGADISYMTEKKAKELFRKLGDALFGTKESEDGRFIPFSELPKNGVKPGDIVIGKNDCAYLLRDGFPQKFNTALCCDIQPNGKYRLYQIGFHWCDSVNNLKFRIATEDEKSAFIRACLDCLLTPIEANSFWKENEYAQIFHSMMHWGLLNEIQAKEVKIALKNLHGINFEKIYKKIYGA